MSPVFAWVLLAVAALPARAGDPPPTSPSLQETGPSDDRLRKFALLKQRALAQAGLTPADGGQTTPAPSASASGSATTPGAAEGADSGPSADRVKRFEALKLRAAQKANLDPVDAGLQPPPPPPPGQAAPTFAQQEAARTAGYDEQFGKGAYEKMMEFYGHCHLSDGCDRLATADVIDGADRFVSLKDQVKSGKLAEGTTPYEKQHGAIKDQIGGAVHTLEPQRGASQQYVEEFHKASDPVVTAVFTPQEALSLALRTAGQTDTAPGYSHLGTVLASQGQLAEAKQAYTLALDRDPRYGPAFTGRALASYGLGDYPDAAQDAGEAVRLSPSNEDARKTLALSQGRLKGGSFAGLNRDIKAPPPGDGALGGALAEAALGLGGSAASAGEPPAEAARGSGSDAWASPAPLAKSAPAGAAGPAGPLVADARKALALGDARAARAAAEKAVAADPRSAAALALAAVADDQLHDYAAALSAADKGLTLVPNDPVLLMSKAVALNHLGRYKEALAAADALIAVSPKNAVARFNRAAALAGLGRRKEAVTALKEAASLDARFTPVYNAALQLPEDSDMAFLFGEPKAPPPPTGPDLSVAGAAAGAAALALLLVAGLVALSRRRPAAAPPPLRAPAGVADDPSTLGGRYELRQRLGGVGVAVVYAGYDTALRRPVVIKRLRDELRLDAAERRRFLREGKALAALRHPNIVRLFSVEENGEDLYLVFDRPEGRTLADVVSLETRLPFSRARALFRGVASALDYAHKSGVEHRDLKPSAIVVADGDQARLLDFGVARLADETARHAEETLRLRHSAYLAPEQRDTGARKESDVYAMGACLYEALTGKPPYRGVGGGLPMSGTLEPPSMAAPLLPSGLDEVLARALDLDPRKRYASAAALQRALETLETGAARA